MLEVQVLQLREARAQLRLTQKRLAELAGVHETTIGAAEKGDTTIRILTAQAILDALNAERIDRGMGPLGLRDINWNIQGS